jgi:hypothetical protein
MVRKKQSHWLYSTMGFSLMEVMIVLFLLGLIGALVLPRIASPTRELKAVIRKLSIISHELHNASRVQQKYFRLVLEMNPDKEHSYWIESSTKPALVPKEVKLIADEDLTIEEKGKIQSDFKLDATVLKEKQILPKGVKITNVEYNRKDADIDFGTAYVHFLPEGRVEEVAIHLSAGETMHWTVYIHPLTGRSQLFGKDIDLKEIRNQ